MSAPALTLAAVRKRKPCDPAIKGADPMKNHELTAQHTPGPWEVGEKRDGDCNYVTAASGPITKTYWRTHPGEGAANAHLIAAAPELLALVIQYRDDLRHPPSGESIERRMDAITAAIAKARGQA